MKRFALLSALLPGLTLAACVTAPTHEHALLQHARSGDIEAARDLIAAGTDPGIVDVESGNGLLAYAASNGHNTFMRFLLDNEFDVNHRNHNGITPLMLAVSAGNYEGIEILAHAGADLDLKNYAPGFTAYMIADSNEDLIAMRLLQDLGASVCAGCRLYSDL